MVPVELDVPRSITDLNSRVGFLEGQIKATLDSINRRLEESAESRKELSDQIADIGNRLANMERDGENKTQFEANKNRRLGLRIAAIGVAVTALPALGFLASHIRFS